MYSSGVRLESSNAQAIGIMQKTSTTVSLINHAGNPEAVVSANPSSLNHDPVSGNVYFKQSGVGTTGWKLINGSSLSPYIVGPTNSDFTTIQAGINAATSAGASSTNPINVYIKPQVGGYAENLTITDGVNLIAFDPSDMQKNVANSVKLGNGITFASGSTQNKFVNINFSGFGGTGIFIAGGTNFIDLQGCTCTSGIIFRIGAGTSFNASFNNCYVSSSQFFPAGVTAGNLSWFLTNSVVATPTSAFSSNTVLIDLINSTFSTDLTVSGTGALNYNAQGQVGAVAVLHTATSSGNFTFNSSNGVIPALDVNPAATNSILVGGGSVTTTRKGLITYANRTVAASTLLNNNDTIVFVTSASGVYTITMPPSYLLTSGWSVVVVDRSGNASVNNITLAGNGLNINGAASFVMNVNFQSIRLVYDGTQLLIM